MKRPASTLLSYLVGLCLAGLGLPGAGAIRPAFATPDGLICDGRVVSQGDYAERVLRVCGEPDARTQRTEYRTVTRRVNGPCRPGQRQTSDQAGGVGASTVFDLDLAEPLQSRRGPRCSYTEEQTVEITVERWTYDFGRNRLVHYLSFEDGQLIHVQVGGYGDKAPAN